jgi:hypothetical protein
MEKARDPKNRSKPWLMYRLQKQDPVLPPPEAQLPSVSAKPDLMDMRQKP